MPFIFENSEWKLRSGETILPLRDFVQNRSRPMYLYVLDDAIERVQKFRRAGANIHYAMKANSHTRLLQVLRDQEIGVDVVSLGEMQKALNCGFAPKKIIFSGVGKDKEELEAALQHRILQINVESFEELKHLAELAKARRMTADVAVRVNIHLAAPTHKHIQTSTEESKFGLDIRLLPEVLQWLKSHPEISLKGLAVHIGSQIMDVSVFEQMSRKMGELYQDMRTQHGLKLERLDLGGGLGLDYKTQGQEDFDRLETYLKAVVNSHNTGAQLFLEPGRFLVARMGVLLAKVVYVKKGLERQFAILNAGMNCLMRPALYQSYHRIEPLHRRSEKRETYSIVGPLCESTDTFAEARDIPHVEPGDWVAVFETGAYGAVMANTYNESQFPEQWSVLDGRVEVT